MAVKDIVARDWKVLGPKMKKRWYSLTDEDVRRVNGNYEMLLSMLQKRYFYSRATAENDANNFLSEFAMTEHLRVQA